MARTPTKFWPFLVIIALLALVGASAAFARSGAIGLSQHRAVARAFKSHPSPRLAHSKKKAKKAVTNGSLLFDGTSVGDFLNQSAPGAVAEVTSPTESTSSAFQMTVNNDDVYPITPTENPRAELVSPPIAKDGTEFWASMKFFLPAEFPNSVPGWLTLLEGPYGPPFEGPPPWHIEVNGDHIQWVRNGTYEWDVPWSMPLVHDQWVEFMIHERFASDGWIEMWVDGQPIEFFAQSPYNPLHEASTSRLAMQTMDASTDGGGGNSIHLMNYREAGMFQTTSVLQGPLRVGTTRTAVEG